jgi:hypothetical protein
MTTPKKTTRRPARKTTARRATARPNRMTLPATVGEAGEAALETGRSLWLAGLGLTGAAIETATDTFDALVAKGRQQEPKTVAAAEKIVRDARRRATAVVGEAARRSKQGVESALEVLGVDNRPRQKNVFHRLGDLAEAIL